MNETNAVEILSGAEVAVSVNEAIEEFKAILVSTTPSNQVASGGVKYPCFYSVQ